MRDVRCEQHVHLMYNPELWATRRDFASLMRPYVNGTWAAAVSLRVRYLRTRGNAGRNLHESSTRAWYDQRRLVHNVESAFPSWCPPCTVRDDMVVPVPCGLGFGQKPPPLP